MAKRNVEEQIATLHRLRDTPVTDATLTALRKGLRDRVNLVAAKAAQIAGDLRIRLLIPDLVTAFAPLFRNGAETDPQCWAKNAMAKALSDLDHDESATFLQGYRYVQLESVWGGKTDTAVTLRSLCMLALVQCRDLPRADKLRCLVAAMTDAEETVRIDALRSLEQMEGEEAALLLRLKAGLGDKRAAVVGQALESLLRLEGNRALDFAVGFLQERPSENIQEFNSTSEEVVEEAALALGASRLPEAVEALKNAWAAGHQVIFLQAISASRQESAFAFLLNLISSGRERGALAAIDALSLHHDSEELRTKVLSAVQSIDNKELRERFHSKFGIR